MMKLLMYTILLTIIASQLLCSDFKNIEAGMTKMELLHRLGPQTSSADCGGDEYLYYIDRWIWITNGIVKGYVLLDNWQGPCYSASYSSQYGKF